MSKFTDEMWSAAEFLVEWGDYNGIRFKALSVPRETIDENDDNIQPALLIIGIDSGNVRRIEELFDPCYNRMGSTEEEILRGLLSHAPEEVKEFAEEMGVVPNRMKSIVVKTTCHGNHVNTTLASPNCPLGDFRDASVQIRRINNIPEEVETFQVIKAFTETCDLTYLGGSPPRLEFDYAELGTGRIIRAIIRAEEDDVKPWVKALKDESDPPDPRFTRDNGDGTTTCGNRRLVVTLPTAEFEQIGRYGVFNGAMRMLANKSEEKLLRSEPVAADQIMQLARSMLIGDYLAEHGRYDLGETLMRMQGGHRMSPGMSEDVAKADAYAAGVLSPVSPEQLREWGAKFFAQHGNDPGVDMKFRREAEIEKLRAGIGVDKEAAEVLASAAEALERDRAGEIGHRSAIGKTCQGWKIEIIGDMPEQVGLCRYQDADEKKTPSPGM